jgi:hypothetical protein
MLDRMSLSNGKYSVSIMIVKCGYFDEHQVKYFTINPGVYACRARILDFEVFDGDLLSSGVVFVGDARWAIRGGG